MVDKKVIAFYKYVKIDDPLSFQREHIEFCKLIGVLGRILVGEEGINGSVYGTAKQTELYKEKLRSNPLFSDIEFKEHFTSVPAFRKLFVRVRKEIVHFGTKIDLENTAKFIEPRELKEMLDNNEEIVLLDMRNDYEALVGRFKGARTTTMRNFRDLPEKMNEINDLKNKKIVTYCTGGIRCEKASAFLKENGFENVMQLRGGILKYCEELPDTYWEGKCFVFDDRMSVQLNNEKKDPLTKCSWCRDDCDNIMNCHNLDCDKLFICCEECKTKHNKSCCENCSCAPRRRKELILQN